MQKKRFNLPPLDLVQGFEAAARNLSFTKAAEELFVTQSAVSRQIRTLEDHLGVALFERHHRALTLTEQGRTLYAAASDLLQRLQDVTDRLRTERSAPQLTITTTNGFASLWLIPRLRGFTARHPDIDVRISATYRALNLERSLIDVAVRYCREETAPSDGIRLFGEELFPVCSPALLNDPSRPLRGLRDIERHTLLLIEEPGGGGEKSWVDWGTWLAAHGLPDLKPGATLRFNAYEQVIGAALSGQGIAMGIGRLVRHLLESGQLVALSEKGVAGPRGYYLLRSATTGNRPHVKAFVDWLIEEANASALAGEAGVSSPRPKGRSNGAGRRAHSAP